MIQQQECSVCGAVTSRQTVTYTQKIGGHLYIVRDVPAQVCHVCGEQYLDPDTVDRIQEEIATGKADGGM